MNIFNRNKAKEDGIVKDAINMIASDPGAAKEFNDLCQRDVQLANLQAQNQLDLSKTRGKLLKVQLARQLHQYIK